ncbi:MAG: dihydrodipicolinate synthase family protein [Propionibacteriaceae bacterium]|jgi:dihydrodipicolinate synthase/N-acetylneuraminate lyase|nr:dihydrodipicolinate synthase family protein [Propionibacteriaceae bacterium]
MAAESNRPPVWRGAASELITPFDPDGEVRLDLVAGEIEFMAARGVVGVMVNGFASEALMIDDQERFAIARAARQATPAGCQLMGTVIAGSTKQGLAQVGRYEALGLDAIAIATPPLYPYGVDALVDYYIAIAHGTQLPSYIYNSPEWGNKLPPEAVARIVQACPTAVGYKDATHSLIELQTLLELIGRDRLSVLSGSDALTVPMMLVGAKGVISLVTTVFPELIVELCQAAAAGQWERAMALQDKTLRVRAALKIGPFMAAYKHVARLLGHDLGSPRHPLTALTSQQAATVEDRLAAEGLL